ncbi:hypothetical protein [Spirillospora sp. NPDC048823]|uniref:hypothetical protein n=1 Tax=unclassified Spirillospora TaxID=2642701 RepID=UPI00371234BE
MIVERALDLLAQCAYRFWDDHGTDEIGALLAEARTCYNAAEHADPATVAIGRSLAAAFELRLCTDVENEVNSGWDYDLEGPPLNGVEEDDWDDVSRPVAELAAEAARAALDADPEDPLVPIHLGHALAWLGARRLHQVEIGCPPPRAAGRHIRTDGPDPIRAEGRPVPVRLVGRPHGRALGASAATGEASTDREPVVLLNVGDGQQIYGISPRAQ